MSNKKKKKIKKSRMKRVISLLVVLVILLGAGGAIWYRNSESYVAKVGNRKILKSEYLYYLRTGKAQLLSNNNVGSSQDEILNFFHTADSSGAYADDALKKQVLDNMHTIELECKKAIDQDPKALVNKIAEVRTTIDNYYTSSLKMTKTKFESYSRENYGLSYEGFVRVYAKSELARTTQEAAIAKIDVSEEDVKNYYDEKPERADVYELKTSVYYTIDTENQGYALSDEQVKKAKDDAEAALVKLNNGADFDALIQEESQSTSKTTDNGEISISLDPDSQYYESNLANAVKEMQINEYKVVEIPDYGYFVIQYVSKKGFEDVKENIKTSLQQNKYNELMEQEKIDIPVVENKGGKIIDKIDVVDLPIPTS